MVELKNCEKCGRLFGYEGNSEKCKKCRNKEEDQFKKVKEFLWKNPNSSLDEIHNNTDVKKELIFRFLNEGRLAAEGLNVNLQMSCERCGKSISKGRYCVKCQQVLIKGFKKDKKDKKDNKKGNGKQKKLGKEMFLKDRINSRKKDK